MLIFAQLAGSELSFEELSDIAAYGARDPAKLAQLAARYGITFQP
jgi:hypothetical protein